MCYYLNVHFQGQRVKNGFEDEYWALLDSYWQGNTVLLRNTPVPVSRFTRDRTRVAAVKGQRVTAWAMAQPFTLYVPLLGRSQSRRTSSEKTLKWSVSRQSRYFYFVLHGCFERYLRKLSERNGEQAKKNDGESR